MITLTNEHAAYRCRVQPQTAAGRDARVDGPPRWFIEDEDPDRPAFTMEVADDGLSARFVNADPGGVDIRLAGLRIEADADLGDGVTLITFEETLVVGPGPAESLGVTFAPEE